MSGDPDICDNISESTRAAHDFASTKEALNTWALKHNITHVASTDLLKILRQHKCFEAFPSDARTLLSTPRYSVVQELSDELYVAFDWINNISKLICKTHETTVNLQINEDGVHTYRSSSKSFWPILANIVGSKKMFSIGIFPGRVKPVNVNEFLPHFVTSCLKNQIIKVSN